MVNRPANLKRIDRMLTTSARETANLVRIDAQKSQAVMALLHANDAFADLADQPSPQTRRAAEAILIELDRTLPNDIVAEACVIDANGKELIRVIGAKPAPVSELSPDESVNDFFASAIASSEKIHQTQPYLSPDSGTLVFATTSVVGSSQRPALLHIETNVASIAPFIQTEPRTWMVDGRSGSVLLDSGRMEHDHSDKPHEHTITHQSRSNDNRFVELSARGQVSGLTQIGDLRVAFERIHPGRLNETLIIAGKAQQGGPLIGWGWMNIVLVVLGIALVVFPAIAYRRWQAIAHRSSTDELTGLANRSAVRSELGRAIATTKPFALLMLDLDWFKEVNDSFGHEAGDLLLIEVSNRLTAMCRPDDVIGRLAGDEFVVLLRHIEDRDTATKLARKLVDGIVEPITVYGVPITLGVSVGIARFPAEGTDPASLLRHADVAMYEAKRTRSGPSLYDPDRDPHNPHSLKLAADLRQALADNSVSIAYQPIVDTASGKVCHLEALFRWDHPSLGPISPVLAVELAERFGLMRTLTDFVLAQALAKIRVLRLERSYLSVAVNLSATSLIEADLVEQVRNALQHANVEPQSLILEITESAVIGDFERARKMLTSLREVGVRLAIDDYGTGHASIGYLRRLPFDTVKIDRSFVSSMVENPVERAIVRTTIDLAHSLGMVIVAEGVERPIELAALEKYKCNFAQGFLFSEPLNELDLDRWLASNDEIASPKVDHSEIDMYTCFAGENQKG